MDLASRKIVAIVLLLLVFIFSAGLLAGYTLSGQMVKPTEVTQILISTVITNTQTIVQVTGTTTTTYIAAQYLNVNEGIANAKSAGQSPFTGVVCLAPCSSPASVTLFFKVTNMTYFYSQVNASDPGVSASASSHSNNTIAVTLTNSNTIEACFVTYLSNTTRPPTIYIWYYGAGACP